MQIVPYADDLAVLARDRNYLKEKTTLIEIEANKKGLYINEHKTKCMTVEKGTKLTRFESKILRKIYIPKRVVGGVYQRR